MIVLEGIDGSGKTSLAPMVAELIGGNFISKKTIPTQSPFAQKTMGSLATALWKSGEGIDFSHEFYLHLQLAWYTGLSKLLLSARNDATPAVVDGWYYKFLARSVVGGCAMEDMLAAFRGVRAPDQVVLLLVDPRDVWHRRVDFREGELGLYHRYEQLGQASFVDYQSRVSAVLEVLAVKLGWHVLRVASSEGLQETANRIANFALLSSAVIGRSQRSNKAMA